MEYPYVPHDWDGEWPDDFWEKIVYEDDNGFFLDYPDLNENGFPDCMEGLEESGIDLNHSWDHSGAN